MKPWKPKQKRGSDAWLFLLLLVGALIIGGYVWVQRRLGNGTLGPLAGGKLTPSPAIPLTPTRSIEENIALADQAYNDGNFHTAITLYDQLSRRRPTDIDLQLKATRLTAFVGQYAKAEQRARRILQNNPKNADARAILCLSLEYQSKLDAALTECQAAVAADPKNATARAYLAEVFTDKGDCVSALGSAQQAADLEPDNPEALHKLGYYHEVCGQSYERALSYYERALGIAPNMLQILADQGRVYLVLANGNPAVYAQKAVDIFGRITELDDQNAEAYSRLGVAYMHQGEFGLANKAHDKAVELNSKMALLWSNRAWMQYRRRFYDEAIVDYARAITTSQITGERISAFDYLRYGFSLQKIKKCDEALPKFSKALEIAPDDPLVTSEAKEGFQLCN